MKSAFYSRNNSYSRSYNASVVEREGRLPRSRAAKELGLSLKAFDAGCAAINYTSSEWHHVGKYANRVDYYDTTELSADPLFWKAATTKSNAQHCKEQISACFRAIFKSKFKAVPKPQVVISGFHDDFAVFLTVDNRHNFRKALTDIIRMRAKKHFADRAVDKRFRFIFLNTDGTVCDRKGKHITYALVDWDNYTPEYLTDKGVRFSHITNPDYNTSTSLPDWA